ncbi:uncharacterized protein LOC125801080 [Astyanax mexicanus]|uniref:uncharacterized protein LOC125801080 n=1 Tax=Astyanax mexicanus TaxID=7994 RepID=UPI0020CB6860|nr:uncharacterized protein LOC125801080 [Astyanax mexicanus]XP_049332725.1 uncharacterized protein LOC125801080 [Astyanax mexicanus]
MVSAEMLWMMMLVFLGGSPLWAFPLAPPPGVVECEYAGRRVELLRDRVRVEGRDVLVLNQVNHTWTMLVTEPAQLDLQQILQECTDLKKKMLNYNQTTTGVSVFGVVATLLAALLFVGFVLLSFKYPEYVGVGGVLGSIIHYPPHSQKEKEKGRSENVPPANVSPY